MGCRASSYAVALVVLLCGCAPKIVYVPVSSCPAPVIGENPVLPIQGLQKGDDIGTVLQAYSASLELCKGRVKELTKKLEGYLPIVH